VTAADIDPILLDLVERDPAAAAAAFGDAFGRTGFAIVADHGIPDDVVVRAMLATRALFALPDAVKDRYVVPGGRGQRGLTPFGTEVAKGATRSDLKEFWHVGRDLAPGNPLGIAMATNLWPAEVPGFREAVSALYSAFDTVGQRILRAIALHLGLAADFFVEPTRNGDSILRLLHYPPVEGQPAATRAEAHEDIDVITLLLGAEEAGLQLLSRDGEWRDVAAPPGTLVCNIGDMLARLTNLRLPSTSHRVVNPMPERARYARYSTPFFLHFRADYLIEALPGCCGPDDPPPLPPITAGDLLAERLREIGFA